MSLDEIKLPILTRSNYQRWKFEVVSCLRALGVYEVVDGTEVCPGGTRSEDIKNWRKLDAKATRVLTCSLTDDDHASIRDCNSSKKIWEKIKGIYESTTSENKHLLSQEWHRMTFDESMSVSNYCAQLSVLIQRLNIAGEIYSETQMIAKLIADLPPKFNDFRFIYRMQVATGMTLTFDQLRQQLMQIEQEFNGSTNNTNTDNALIAKNTSNINKRKPKKQKTVKCYYCGKLGHIKRECRKLQADQKITQGLDTATPAIIDKPSTSGHYFVAASGYSSTLNRDEWLGDSGASHHMTFRRKWFKNFTEIPDGQLGITVGNNEVVYAQGRGEIDIISTVGNQQINRTLADVLYVPKIGKNLFSLGATADKGISVHVEKRQLELLSNGKVVGIGKRMSNGMYIMNFETLSGTTANVASIGASINVWHERLGHTNYKTIRKMATGDATDGMSIVRLVHNKNTDQEHFCEGCILGKTSKKSFEESTTRAKKPGELIHFDICGPMSTESFGGSKFMIVFTDDLSGMVSAKPLKSKGDIVEHIENLIAEVAAAGHKIQRMRSDNAKEFISADIKRLMRKHSILQELSSPYCPQQNGRAERQNRTIVEMARSMLVSAELPTALWGEAVNAATHIRNMVPLERLQWRSPYEIWYKRKPNVEHLRIYGSKAYALIDEQHRSKFDSKCKLMRLVGYEPKSRAFRLWEPGTKRVIVRRDVTIVESSPRQQIVIVPELDKSEDDLNTDDTDIKTEVNVPIKTQQKETTENSNKSPVTHQSRQNIKLKEAEELPIATRTRSKSAYISGCAFMAGTTIPESLEEARSSMDSKQWESAMAEELKSLKCNRTWTLMEPPSDCKPIKNKWIFRIKTKPNGSIDKYKARLVVKGCSQRIGIDFNETFSPVTRFDSIRTMLAVAATKDYEIYQFDIKTAFLYSDLEETIYMEQPDGFQDNTNRVCKLNKSLYGLKQAPRQWYTKFDKFMQQLDLKQTNADPCVYIANGKELYVALYVDDGLVVGKSEFQIKELLNQMQDKFQTTFTNASCYLGLEISRDRKAKTIRLTQSKYTKATLEKFNMTEANSQAVPMDPNTILRKVDEEILNVPYRQLIGSLMYLAIGTRPDISYAVGILSKFLEMPSTIHWNAGKRVLKYLRGTADFGLTYGNTNNEINQLVAYSDADYASCVDTRRSISGIVLMLNGGPINWSSRKQTIVATSTTEAEYIAAYEAAKETVWTRRLLEQIGVQQNQPTILNIDNTAAEKLLKNPILHRRTKHIDVKFHYTRKLIENNIIEVCHVQSSEQLADIFTKPQTRDKFETNRRLINLS